MGQHPRADFTFTGQFPTNDPKFNVAMPTSCGDVQQWSTSTQPEHGMRAKNFSFLPRTTSSCGPNVTINLGVRSGKTHAE